MNHTGPHHVTVRDDTSATPGCQLVVGYDRHDAAPRALAFAADLADRLGGDLHIVHAINLSDYPLDPDTENWEEQARETLRGEERAIGEALADYSGHWSFHAAHGDPVRLLGDVAEQTDALMVVIGAHGHGFGATVARMLGGSTEYHLLAGNATRPVVVVPDGTADPG